MSDALSIVIPVKDEELILEEHTRLITEYLAQHSIQAELIFIENGSTDNTWNILQQLTGKQANIIILKIEGAFFGEAIKAGCLKAKHDIVIMSIDLTMGLDFISTCHELLKKYDIVNGSRFLGTSVTNRKRFRRIASSVYHPFATWLFNVSFTDFDGNKAIRNSAAKKIIPKTKSKHNFFFTELLVIAHNNNFSIIETPLDHIENRKSRFSIRKLIFSQIKDLLASFTYLKQTKV